MKGIILTVLVLIVLGVVAGLLFIYSGVYNIAASEDHNALEKWVLETTMERSIESHAEGIEAPDLSDSAMLVRGFDHFDAMCVQCHGAPGIGRAEFAEGLNPAPPSLVEAGEEWTASELFWITKHGIKATGMPAFGGSHDDEDIWAMVAFMQTLPDIGYYGYLDLREARSASGSGDEDGHENHEH